jgi:hypothetical protein
MSYDYEKMTRPVAAKTFNKHLGALIEIGRAKSADKDGINKICALLLSARTLYGEEHICDIAFEILYDVRGIILDGYQLFNITELPPAIASKQTKENAHLFTLIESLHASRESYTTEEKDIILENVRVLLMTSVVYKI